MVGGKECVSMYDVVLNAISVAKIADGVHTVIMIKKAQHVSRARSSTPAARQSRQAGRDGALLWL